MINKVRPKKNPEDLRTNIINVYFNDVELKELKEKAEYIKLVDSINIKE